MDALRQREIGQRVVDVEQAVDLRVDRGALPFVGRGERGHAERVAAVARRLDVLDEQQPVDDVAGLDRLDRDARIGRRGAQAVGAQRERLAQGEDELVDLGQRVAVVQPALEAVPEQRGQALAVADALEHAEGAAHPLGGQVDRERVGRVASTRWRGSRCAAPRR